MITQPSSLSTAVRARARGMVARFGWRGLLSLGFLITFVASFALAGFSYMFCLSVGRVQTVCCCHAANAQHELSKEESGPSITRTPCCETRHFEASTSSSSTPPDPGLTIAAPMVAILGEPTRIVAPVVQRAVSIEARERRLPPGRAPPPTAVHLRTVRLLC